MKPVRALILDDSAICRDRLREILTRDRDISVVGEAENGDRVLELIRQIGPSILLVDLQMPGTGGHETIERVMANHPLPILVVTGQPSAVNQKAVFESIRRGALDLAEKPEFGDAKAEASLRGRVRELSQVPVVRHMAGTRNTSRAGSGGPLRPSLPPTPGGVHVVSIGASAGGPLAVAGVLGALPPSLPAAVTVVQHLPKGYARAFCEFLRARTSLPVTVVTRRTAMEPGHVYIADDDRHLVALDAHHLGPSEEPEIEGHRPAVDALFRSLADHLKKKACGVVMSGIGRDGTAGLLELKARGSLTLAQDEISSGVFGMPRAALEARAAERALDPPGLAREVTNWALESARGLSR
ncbi:MAG TPA: chemotaxis protein CheB [Polyangiaceae bacterium]|nr:chemotaxis protein CheB [Polyangiaceae bacterium]